ncbi:MAG: hypothetical protein P4N24_07310 [Acidobacteriota bacterium]|nr:hypothetical protein [Acidobacteriota bacterium]
MECRSTNYHWHIVNSSSPWEGGSFAAALQGASRIFAVGGALQAHGDGEN